MSREDFERTVRTAIEYIEAGDAFQIVPSIRFEAEFGGDAFCRVPSSAPREPFSFHVSRQEWGTSRLWDRPPELMSRVRGGRAYSRPIAGTRPRGETREQDRALEEDLLSDPKERAEHTDADRPCSKRPRAECVASAVWLLTTSW